MKINTVVKLFAIASLSTLIVGESLAQQADSSLPPLKIRKLAALGARARVETPNIRSDVARGSSNTKKWHSITVMYDTSPEWLDDLTVEFHVLSAANDPETNKKVYSLYKLVVRYANIERGRGHLATAFLTPAALKRYGEPIVVSTVFSVNGKVIDTATEDSEQMPEKWWSDPRVTDRDDVVLRKGSLLNRADTPWAVINFDDYEEIQ